MNLFSKRILWLSYFDPNIPRRLGRRIPKKSLVRRPRPEEILEACKSLGIKCEINKEKRYPRLWYQESFMITAYYDGKKTELIKSLLKILQNIIRK